MNGNQNTENNLSAYTLRALEGSAKETAGKKYIVVYKTPTALSHLRVILSDTVSLNAASAKAPNWCSAHQGYLAKVLKETFYLLLANW